jgi:Lipocalin-like domain
VAEKRVQRGLVTQIAPMHLFASLVDGHPLVGTWKMKSYVVTTENGERSTPYGEHPSGYLTYTVDGRMHVIGIAQGRLAARGAVPTEEEQAVLQKTMFAYAGTYSADSETVIHHVEVSWNEVWSGTDQVRLYKVDGQTLIVTTHLTDPATGAEARYVVEWEKVDGPSRSLTR